MQTITNHVKEGASYTEGACDVYASERKQMRESTGLAQVEEGVKRLTFHLQLNEAF